MRLRLYSRMIEHANYKVLASIPIILSILMVGVLLTNGLELGIDFKGGVWIDVLTEKELTQDSIQELSTTLTQQNLEDVKVYTGYDIDSGKNKLTVITTSMIDRSTVMPLIQPYTGALTEFDRATATTVNKPPVALREKLNKRLNEDIDLEYADNKLTIIAIHLDQEELESALNFYLGEEVDVELETANFNLRSVGPTLGQTFRDQGVKAVAVAFLMMAIVVFLAFRDFVPSIAVVQAAICDVLLAVGGMSLLGIQLEPASLAALLMLIGYSVDTDIMLTTRVIKGRTQDIEDRIDEAMKTGLTMTGTTIGVMVVVFIISTYVTQIPMLASIASVLLIGLFADLVTTWFTNAGILKWYMENPKKLKRMFKR